MIRIESNQPTKRNNANLLFNTAAGAALGMGARYILPTKAELKSLKSQSDTFFSSASNAARAAKRPMLKYGIIGAVIAAGLCIAQKVFAPPKPKTKEEILEVAKINAIIDAPDYVCELIIA